MTLKPLDTQTDYQVPTGLYMTKYPQCLTLLVLAAAPSLSAAVVVTTTKSASAPTVSSTDLAQTQFLSSTSSSAQELGSQSGQLFNGQVGNTDGDASDPGEVLTNPNDSFTINFDVSSNTYGYDITRIYSVFGWSTGSNGRSNQGYGIQLTYMNDTTAILMTDTVWEPNSPASYWTTVEFTNSSGGALYNDSYNLNLGSSTTGTDVLASGVKSITIFGIDAANAAGVVVMREFDIEGTATIPEPGTTGLLGLASLGLLLRRKR